MEILKSRERKSELQSIIFLKERANGSKTQWNPENGLKKAKQWMSRNRVRIARGKGVVETSKKITFQVAKASKFKSFTEVESSDDINFILGWK